MAEAEPEQDNGQTSEVEHTGEVRSTLLVGAGYLEAVLAGIAGGAGAHLRANGETGLRVKRRLAEIRDNALVYSSQYEDLSVGAQVDPEHVALLHVACYSVGQALGLQDLGINLET